MGATLRHVLKIEVLRYKVRFFGTLVPETCHITT